MVKFSSVLESPMASKEFLWEAICIHCHVYREVTISNAGPNAINSTHKSGDLAKAGATGKANSPATIGAGGGATGGAGISAEQ